MVFHLLHILRVHIIPFQFFPVPVENKNDKYLFPQFTFYVTNRFLVDIYPEPAFRDAIFIDVFEFLRDVTYLGIIIIAEKSRKNLHIVKRAKKRKKTKKKKHKLGSGRGTTKHKQKASETRIDLIVGVQKIKIQEINRIEMSSTTTTTNKICVFDVETTGLISKKQNDDGSFKTPLPYILQLCFIVFDTSSGSVVSRYNKYISIPETVVISDFITNLTGISRAHCSGDDAVPIESALIAFYDAIITCHSVIAHNIAFDREMVAIEFRRHRLKIESACPQFGFLVLSSRKGGSKSGAGGGGDDDARSSGGGGGGCGGGKSGENAVFATELHSSSPSSLGVMTRSMTTMAKIKWICTMMLGKQLCNIMIQPARRKNKQGVEYTPRPYQKFPKLVELFTRIFDQLSPENMHDAFVDAMVCLRCFVFLTAGERIDEDLVLVAP